MTRKGDTFNSRAFCCKRQFVKTMENLAKKIDSAQSKDFPALRHSTVSKNFSDRDEQINERKLVCESDSLKLAHAIRLSQGTFETEICCGPESDLHKEYDNCKKDPSHKGFKPFNSFSFYDIPERYRLPIIYDVIRDLAQLTVRIMCTFSSSERPEKMKGEAYPSYKESEGKQCVRYGTGRIFNIINFTEKDDKPCPCSLCKASGQSTFAWCLVEVITARHVVFNDHEARATKCRWGYDSDDCCDITFEGLSSKVSDRIEDDWCKLKCVTHVTALGKLRTFIESFNTKSRELYLQCRSIKQIHKLTVIVSHPHGCPKQISIGYWRQRHHVGGVDTKYTYSSSTCNGSSGAAVYILGRDGKLGLFHQIHSGCKTENGKLNNHSCGVVG
ncbi:unnamed protein product [Lymnaea stagnalis]|uniref:Uncharacterized protein n=1 Tax=Lymnaea stagnalis TaxID=6523 RepID=A0AAV2IAK7_LYMST